MDRKRRRAILFTLACLPAGGPLLAQVPARPARIGLLPELNADNRQSFLDMMQEHGWRTERDFVLIEPTQPGVRMRQVPSASARASEDINALTQALVEQKPQLILATSTAYAVAVRRFSLEIPVVMWTSGYPVEAGVADRMARPGKNVTGNTIYAGTGFWGKLVELLREAKPGIDGVGVLWDYAVPAFSPEEIAPAHEELARAARKLQIALHIVQVSRRGEIDAALAELEHANVGALVVTSGWALSQVRERVMRFATQRGLPVIVDFRWPSAIEPYPLLVYSASQSELMRVAAQYCVRILTGAPVADLPINQPSRFDLVINLRTAQALRLSVPETLRLRAQRVVE